MLIETQQILQAELEPGERLLWSGQPKQGIRPPHKSPTMNTMWFYLWVPLSLFFLAVALFFGLPSGFARAGSFLIAFVGVLVVALNLYLIFGRHLVGSSRRSHLFYGVTDKRVIFLTLGRRRETKSLALSGIREIFLIDHADETGDIVFVEFPAEGLRGMLLQAASWGVGKLGLSSQSLRPTFENIENAGSVYDVVSEAQIASSVDFLNSEAEA